MATPDAILASLQADLAALEREITEKERECDTVHTAIADTLQPASEAAQKAFRDAPHSNSGERNARNDLKDNLEDRRAELTLVQGNFSDAQRHIVDLKSRKTSLQTQISSVMTNRAQAAAAAAATGGAAGAGSAGAGAGAALGLGIAH